MMRLNHLYQEDPALFGKRLVEQLRDALGKTWEVQADALIEEVKRLKEKA
jgi:hypothetical protein